MIFNRSSIKDAERPPAAEPSAADWTAWLRIIERKRRLLARFSFPGRSLPADFLAALTGVSFCLDGLLTSSAQVAQALASAASHRPCRSRLSERLRNHVAILHGIERALALGRPLKVPVVVRWYTSVSCGLSTADLDEPTMDRLDHVVGRISSPRLRLQPAVQDAARLHTQLMTDPLVPSFNGIMARLLLCYQLGRCGLPPVLFDPIADRLILSQEEKLLPRLMNLIDASYSVLLSSRPPGLLGF